MKRIAVAAAIACAAATIGTGRAAPSSVEGPLCHGRAPTIVGTEGDDVIRGTARSDVIVALGGTDVVQGGFGHDTVCGGSGDDELAGGLGSDVLYGEEGDDDLSGGSDPDSLLGGEGADVVAGDDAGDHLTGGPDLDEVDGGDGIDWASADDLDAPVTIDLETGLLAAIGDSDVLTAVENAEGSPFDDAISGDHGPNALRGGEGSDALEGSEGADVLDGSFGDDSLDGGGGRDTASFEFARGRVEASLEAGSATGDGVDAFVAIENLTGGLYDDHLVGSSGRNVLSGGVGEDLLEGGSGADRFVPGLMDDRIVGGPGDDWMLYLDAAGPIDATMRHATVLGEGTDTYEGIDVVSGSNRSGDVIRGDRRANRLYGGAGMDRLYGAGGRDYLVGGPMKDLLDGGPGRDACEDVMVNRFARCEALTHGDGPSQTVMTSPRYAATYRGPVPRSLSGYVGGSRAPIEVAIVRVGFHGCYSWTGRAWAKAACDARTWLPAEGRRRWSHDLPSRMPPARYELFARVRRSAEEFEAGRNAIFFHVR